MSIKDLFGRKYVPSTTEKEAFDGVESARNVKAVHKKQEAFVPQVDYSDPQTFARYGSANLYYKSAINRILDFYPYDGSNAEITEFYNKSLDIEKYIFDSRYPRTTGYINISADGWGSTTKLNGYGVASSLEYITFNGGPGVLNETQSLNKLIPDPTNSKFQYNNIYDENIYDNHGLPSDYGDGTRQSNLKSNFDTGVTIEFWAMTGSTPAVMNPLTERQVVFDMWNNNPSASADESYGRIRIELQNSDANSSPFLITVQSGTLSGTVEQFNTSSIGSGLNLNTMESWKHYAFVMKNINANQLQIKLYVDGELNDTLTGDNTSAPGELASKNMQGRIGGLLTAPSKLAVGGTLPSAYSGGGKLSGSIDEFRFWKTARNAEQIGRYWFDQVRGGVNTDIANASLGMYYKFNEGISQTASLDSVVLDYGGRLCNGVWTGYSSNSRNTGSAIVSASAAAFEYRDPIIYASHPDVVTLKSELASLGLYHDAQNSAQFLNLIPSWVVEEVEADGDSNLEQVSHIMGAYFDKLYLQISALPSFRHGQYTSASYKPLPFSQHLPQSLGLYTPEIFVDSDVLERFANRTNKELFEKDLNDTKNLIYQNLYNNLTTIFKSKGTERGIRSVLRCFNIDDNLVYFNIYSNNETYELKNNLKQTQKRRKMLNMNTASNAKAVMFQAPDPAYPSSLSYISGSGELGYEDNYGFTLETSVRFPRFLRNNTTFNRNFITSSLFGIQTVNTSSAAAAIDCTFLTGGQDVANFQVQAIRDTEWSKNVYFKLTSSYDPHPFDALTSSNFYNVYSNEDWNLSVALKPSKWPYAGVLSGSDDYTYDVIFRGFNNRLGTISNSFEVSASVSKEVGQSMLRSWKRVYVGAHSTNLTGSNVHKTDVMFNGTKYWTQYLENVSLRQHAVDRENFGISGSYQNVSALGPLAKSEDTYNFNTLALNWSFGTITGSSTNTDELFYSTDLSSGSAFIRNNFGWAGELAGYIHAGRGHNFPTESTTVVHQELVNEFKFINPELAVGSDMVNILTEDDELFGTFDEVPNYTYLVEKSLQAALSEEILDYFAGVIDFNNLIGDPVNRYRMEYKGIELLRRIFFERFEDIKTVEMYTEYFRWFDDAIANIIEQIVPASADFIPDMYNTVESHVLERNKYQSKFPTLEFRAPDPEASLKGINELLASYELSLFGGVEASPRPTDLHKEYWKKRAQPGAEGVGSYEISSGDADVDAQRRIVRNQMYSKRVHSASQIILSAEDGTRYEVNQLLDSQLGGDYVLHTPTIHRTIKGGVNFEPSKNIHYTYTSLYPAGPINTTDGVFVPQNVLYSDLASMEAIDTLKQWEEEGNPGKKRKRYMGVVQGRDYDGGYNYTHTKNTIAFPFNVMSASISGGADVLIRDRASSSITITNLHNDVYGPEMEKPMQGPFTEYAVGGHQSRHVPLNSGSDDYTNRPEAWKILLGKRTSCPNPVLESGAIGMAGADYPWPEANEPGETPYPMTSSQKAVYYRGMMAKRPVNIRNIQLRTGSTILGNYEQNYQIVMTNGAYINPRNFIENQPSLPTGAFQNTATSSTQIRTFLSVHRTDDDHFDWIPDYSVSYLTSSSKNKTVITNRFANPGGIDSAAPGYRDFRANEYTPYVSPNYRNLSVLKHSQPPSGTFSEPPGAGTAGIRVSDIHGRDVGLTSHCARHTARFGRDPVALPTIPYTLTSSMYVRSPSVYTYSSSAGLQAWWRLNEDISTSGDAIDSSGNGRNGTPSNRPAFSTIYFPNKFIQTGSCTFDGSDDDNNIGAAATWDAIIGNDTGGGSTEKMTLSGWIRPLSDGENNFGRVIDFGNQDVAIFVSGESGGAVYLSYSAKFTGAIGTWSTTSRAITLSEWTHVAVTFDATSASNDPVIYINGVAVAITETSTPSGTYDGITTSACHIGNNAAGTRTFDGQLADVAVWNTILAAADVQAIAEVGSILYANSITATEVAAPGLTYNQLPSFHKTHRNTRSRLKMSSITYTPAGTPLPVYVSSSQYDNFNVSYQIPRSTMQYAWITASVASSSIYYDQGYTPKDFLVRGPSSSAGPGTVYVEPLGFVSASDVKAFAGSGFELAMYATEENPNPYGYTGLSFLPQTARLNSIVRDPMSASTNTIGFDAGTPLSIGTADSDRYLNHQLVGLAIGALTNKLDGPVFNTLMTKRGNNYAGANWNRMRQDGNPILVNEKKTNKLSTMYLGNVQRNFDLPPVSMRGRPVLVNLDFVNSFYTNRTGKVEQFQNATFKTSYNNEMIGFNEWELNRFTELNYDSEVTPFEQLVAMKDRNNIKINWVTYTENILPTNRREFLSASTTRVGYDNRFWRRTQTDRVTAGMGVSNSVGVYEYTDWGPITRYITQSIWPLDAPEDFLTRTMPPVIASNTVSGFVYYTGSSLITSNSAGELQNTYQMCHFTPGQDPSTAVGATAIHLAKITIPLCMRNGALYSRKHMLNSPLSIQSPNSIRVVDSLDGANLWTTSSFYADGLNLVLPPKRATQIPGMDGRCYKPGAPTGIDETLKPSIYGPLGPILGLGDGENGYDYSPYFMLPIQTGSGEAVWEAPTQAGYITMSNGGSPDFVSAPSEPWYNDYDDFRQDIKTLAKGFVVVPEYRVSDHVENYVRLGTTNTGDFNILSIPGTALSSSQQNFYKDYSNSEFLKHFLDIRKMSGLKAEEIKLTCEASIKFNPYKGFYPADRSLELVSQFSKSFAQYTSVASYGANAYVSVVTGGFIDQYSYTRPLYQSLFAPGILYNSIKSGIGVDYPIMNEGSHIENSHIHYSGDSITVDNFVLNTRNITGSGQVGGQQGAAAQQLYGYVSGAWWDKRIPFEAIINPATYLNNVNIVEVEPHPSVSNPYAFTASLNSAPNGSLYNLMASNFVAEVGKFFLKDQQYSRLASNGVNLKKYKFNAGESYGARLRMRTSYDGVRTYEFERGYSGSNLGYSYDGAQAFFKNRAAANEGDSNCWVSGASYEIPQDPALSPSFQQNFVMYSRPTAFGPPLSGRVWGTGSGGHLPGGGAPSLANLTAHNNSYALSASTYGVKDALNGYNWSFTPPYYHGESWIDFIFHPSASTEYDLQTILQETKIVKRRYEPGADRNGSGDLAHKSIDGYYLRTLVSDTASDITASSTDVGTYAQTFAPYASENINDNAMQIDSCVNLFGVELIPKETVDKYGNRSSTQNETTSDRWVIQTKFETPMLNFADVGSHPITASFPNAIGPSLPSGSSTLSLPVYSSGSVPRGMWHQFGVQPDASDKGIFLSIGEIPQMWLKNHYEVVTGSSAYNNYEPTRGPEVYQKMKSFSTLMGFDSTNSSTKLGQIAETQTIREAVVAIPYVLEGLDLGEQQPAGENAQTRKKFIDIPKKRFDAAMKNKQGSAKGDSLGVVGASIRKMAQNVEKYIFPPQFDFMNNSNIKPIVMYMFEFEYKLDQDDLSYIWQNIAPRDYKKLRLEKQSVAHTLGNTELLTERNLLANPDLRWMVFKVKQRSQAGYEEMVTDRIDEPTRQSGFAPWAGMYPQYLRYNWPYDFVSIVESIKLDVDIKYNRTAETPGLASSQQRTRGQQNQTLNKKMRRKIQVDLKKKQ